MKPSTLQGNHVERIHGTNEDPCEWCARDEHRSSGWLRVQQALLRGGSRDSGGSDSARTPEPSERVERTGQPNATILKALLHRAETQSARVKYLEQKGPAVSPPQHAIDMTNAQSAERKAWSDFQVYAETGDSGSSDAAREISQRLQKRR